MKAHFLTIGFSSKKIHVSSALQNGAKISLLIGRDKFKKEYEQIFHKVLIVDDIYDWKELKKTVDQLNQIEKIDAVLTRHENYVSLVGAINQHLGLVGINYATARSFCNKYSMKQKWLAASVNCADGICLNDQSGLDEFLDRHSFPLILKKTSAAHSNFVVKVNSKEDLLEKLAFLKSHADGYVTSKPVKNYDFDIEECHFLLEEMLFGRELTVDTFVSQGNFTHTQICEYVLANELDVDDSYLPIRTMPTLLNEKQKKIVLETTEKALQALGAKNCVCHTELFLNEENNSCSVIESTPRSGGNRAEMTIATSGYDYNLAVFQASADFPIKKITKPKKAISIVEYFAEEKGVIEKINLDFLVKHPAVSNLKIRNQIGDNVEQAKFGGKTIASFYVTAEDCVQSRTIAIELFKQVQKSIEIKTKSK